MRLCYEDYIIIIIKEYFDFRFEMEIERYKIYIIGLEVFKFVVSFKIRIMLFV